MAHEVAPTAGADLVRSLAELTPFVGAQWPAGSNGPAGPPPPPSMATPVVGERTNGARPLRGAGSCRSPGTSTGSPCSLHADRAPGRGRQEWDRSVAFELFEQHRVADAPGLPCPSVRAQAGAQALLEGEVRSYYEATTC